MEKREDMSIWKLKWRFALNNHSYYKHKILVCWIGNYEYEVLANQFYNPFKFMFMREQEECKEIEKEVERNYKKVIAKMCREIPEKVKTEIAEALLTNQCDIWYRDLIV